MVIVGSVPKSFVLFALLLVATLAALASSLAYSAEMNTDEINQWIQDGENKLSSLAANGGIPGSVVILKDIKQAAGLEYVDPAVDKLGLGIFKYANIDNLQWSLRINKSLDKFPKEKGETLKIMDQVAGITGASLVLYAPSKAPAEWVLRYDDGKKMRSVAPIADSSGSRRMEVMDWLMDSVGYNGVVIDERGDYFLVAGNTDLLAGDSQAVVLGGTSDKPLLENSAKAGTALLRLVRSSGVFGVFRLSFQKPGKAIPEVGDKLSLSK